MLKLRVEHDAVVPEADLRNQRLVGVTAESAVGDVDVPVQRRLAGRAANDHLRVQAAAEAAILEQQLLRFHEIDVGRADLQVRYLRIVGLRRQHAISRDCLVAVDQFEIEHRELVRTVLDRRFGPGHQAPFLALGAYRQSREVQFLMVWMKDDLPRGVELSRIVLQVRREIELLRREGHLGLDVVDLHAADLHEVRGKVTADSCVGNCQLGNLHVECAAQIERLVALVSDVVAADRSAGPD